MKKVPKKPTHQERRPYKDAEGFASENIFIGNFNELLHIDGTKVRKNGAGHAVFFVIIYFTLYAEAAPCQAHQKTAGVTKRHLLTHFLPTWQTINLAT